MHEQLSKPILDAYKTVGSFTHGPVSTSKSHPFSIAACCYNSFKIYSSQLAIKMVSAVFGSPIRAIHVYNEFTYIVVGLEIIKIKYHHVVSRYHLTELVEAGGRSRGRESVSMLVFDGLIVVAFGGNLCLVSELNSHIQVMSLGISVIEVVHPVTYVNKVIAYSSDKILLVNPISQKILYDYSKITKQILTQNKKVVIVCPSPLVDIVAVCLDSGQIVIVNIRTSKIVFTMKQKKVVTAISFSQSDSLMVTGDQAGNIILWDLENKKIIYRLQAAFPNSISSIFFVPGFPLVTATSSKANSIKQFRINLDDNKTLLQFRQRSGCSSLSSIISIKCQNNKEITFNTKNSTVFSSLYSHSNMYTLPVCLDSKLPYHIVGRNFSIQVYKQRTIIGKLNIQESPQLARFSITNKFTIVGTKSRLIKIGIPSDASSTTILHKTLEWQIKDPLSIILYKQQYIYVLCFDNIYVLSFNQPNIVATINEGNNCYNLVSNLNQSMLAMENRTKESIEIWDMGSISLSRQFSKTKNKSNCSKICFTSDNRYLLTAHIDHSVLIWSILQSNLYKVIQLQGTIMDMCFVPDNSYLLSVFQGGKQINIWHNYIGKITTSQNQKEVYKFETKINELCSDYRQKLNQQKQQFNTEIISNQHELFDDLLDEIQNPNDLNTQNYNFTNVSKWMPLVYYDEIKNRNSINKNDQIPSLPFFLDFKNISQQQNKIKNQMKKQAQDKKNRQKQKIDAQLSNELHQIRLNKKSSGKDYQQTWNLLSSLSVAETDYQLRRFLMLPKNSQYLLRMLSYILDKRQSQTQSANLMLLNIIITRTLDIIGSEICEQSLKDLAKDMLQRIQSILRAQEDVIYRCISVASQST